jgi:hypothetical protein
MLHVVLLIFGLESNWRRYAWVRIRKSNGDAKNGYEEVKLSGQKLREIVVPRSVKVIKYGAFGFCRGLMRVKLDEGLEEIGERAFYYCTTLREITIPRSVRVIREEVFCCCHVLTTVIPSNIPNRLGLVGERK